ncbi:hypothetical protein ES708_22054 [subsurface metagenome]
MLLALMIPEKGKKTSGSNAVAGNGIASEIHHTAMSTAHAAVNRVL